MQHSNTLIAHQSILYCSSCISLRHPSCFDDRVHGDFNAQFDSRLQRVRSTEGALSGTEEDMGWCPTSLEAECISSIVVFIVN